MSYATVEEYETRYGKVLDKVLLQECLDDCSVVIDTELERHCVDASDPSKNLADRLMRVCRSMAKRIMPSDDEADIPVGATQASFTAGPYNQQFTFSATYGTPKLIDSERRMLGIGGTRIGYGRLT